MAASEQKFLATKSHQNLVQMHQAKSSYIRKVNEKNFASSKTALLQI